MGGGGCRAGGAWGVVGRDLVTIIVGGITLGFRKLSLNHILH